MTDSDELRPVCFMVMPFNVKPTRSTKDGAPTEVDFNCLWDKVYQPAIQSAGYTAVRADFDAGSVIIKDMIERLAYADLVLADVSLANANVYYEVGLRHVAREKGCILFAADWSRQPFDINQFRTIRFPLNDAAVSDTQASQINKIVKDAIGSELGKSRSPWFEYLNVVNAPEWPVCNTTVFRQEAKRLSGFQARLQSIRLNPIESKRKELTQKLVIELTDSPALNVSQIPAEMVFLIRDVLEDWKVLSDFIERLDADTRDLPFFQEQLLLAKSYQGEHAEAIAHLQTLIQANGETPERLGLIGGRYKRIWQTSKEARIANNEQSPSADEQRFLTQSISFYEKGMELDLNQYYCSGNLANLLLERAQGGDKARAVIVDHFVVAACERALKRGEDDAWTRQTLLGAAFRAQDPDKAEQIVQQVINEGAIGWNVDTTRSDIAKAIDRVEKSDLKAKLVAIDERLIPFSRKS